MASWYAFEDELIFFIYNCETVLLMAHNSFDILILLFNHEKSGIDYASVIWGFSDEPMSILAIPSTFIVHITWNIFMFHIYVNKKY